MQKQPFTELGIAPELLKAVEKMGFEEASPIQSMAIPVLLTGKDVVGQSQTGSGKTAAFAIPAIQAVDIAVRGPQVIIMCPTRELALQVAEEVAKLAIFKRGVRELPIYGGQSYDRQFRGLQAGAQIIIGTPGRIIDHLERGTLVLDGIKMVILDEADRMLDMGFSEEIERILKAVPTERQTALFSATLPRGIKQLVEKYTRNPEHLRIEAQELTVPAIEQTYYEVDRRSKLEVLCRLIDVTDVKLGLVFCSTKMMVDELTEHLTARGYAADKLHGDMTQMMRERVLKRFRERKVEFLIATDVAARGLDVDDIEVVFNYDLPHDSEDYVHRIGRTGRAGRSGRAITFVAGREIYKLQMIMRATKARIAREKVPTIEEVESRRANHLFDTLRGLLEKGDYRKQDELVDRLLESSHSPTDIASALMHMLSMETTRDTARILEDDPNRFQRPERPERGDRGDFNDGPRGRFRDDAPRGREGREGREGRDGRDSRDRRGGGFEERGPRGRGPAGDFESTVANEPGMCRISLSVGRMNGIEPRDVLGFALKQSGLDRTAVGAIRILAQHTFVDVVDEHAERMVRMMNGKSFRGRTLAARIAS